MPRARKSNKAKTPVEELVYQLSFRIPMPVTQVVCYERYWDCMPKYDYFARCPKCKITMEREYQKFCDRCGQMLDWKEFGKAEVICVPASEAENE